MHPESKTGARRTYQYYHYAKGDWEGPTTRAFGKMNKTKFERLCIERILNKGPWQDPLLEGNLLDPATVGPLPQEGLVDTSRSRPRGDDVLKDPADSRPPIADSRSPIADNRPPIADSRPPIADSRSPIADSRPPTADFQIEKRTNQSTPLTGGWMTSSGQQI